MADNLTINRGGHVRLPWIDWAKAVGIYLVVLGHMPVLYGKIYIYMFHMPFFFIISGFLFKPRPFQDECIKSFKRLIVPYWIYNLVLLAIATCLLIITPENELDSKAFTIGSQIRLMIFDIITGNLELMPYRFFRPLWFLISLFIMRLVCCLVKEKHYWVLFSLTITASISLTITKTLQVGYTNDYFQIQTTLVCLPFFLIGYFARKYKFIDRMEMIPKVPKYVLLGVIMCGSVYLGYNNSFVNVFTCETGKNVFVYYIVGIVISMLLLHLCSVLFTRRNGLIELVSKGTILILGLHVVLIEGLFFPFHHSTFSSVICSILVIAICVLLISAVSKYMPIALGDNSKPDLHNNNV